MALLLLSIVYIGRDIHWASCVAVMLLILSLPYPWFVIHDFRPDSICSLCTALGVYLSLEASNQTEQRLARRFLLLGGICFALALLSKPIFIGHTGVFVLFSISIYLLKYLTSREQRKDRMAILSGLRDLIHLVAPIFILGTPFVLFGVEEKVGYFLSNITGDPSAAWRIEGGLGKSLAYFAHEPVGQFLGPSRFTVAGLILLGLTATLVKSDRNELRAQCLLIVAGLLSFMIVAAGRMEQPFLGVFYIAFAVLLLIRSSVFSILAMQNSQKMSWGFFTIFGIAMLLNFVTFEPARVWPHNPPQSRNIASKENSTNERIIEALIGHPATKRMESSRVFVTFSGLVNEFTLDWLASKDHLNLSFFDHHVYDQLDRFKKAIYRSAFILHAEDNTVGVFEWLPSWSIHSQVADLIESDPRFKLETTFDTPGPGSYRLYSNSAVIDSEAGSFGEFDEWTGFLPFEGPYPQWKLGIVRWALWPQSTVVFTQYTPGQAILEITARSPYVQKMAVFHNDSKLTDLSIGAGDEFSDWSIPIACESHHNVIEFVFEQEPVLEADGFQRAVLFKKLSLR